MTDFSYPNSNSNSNSNQNLKNNWLWEKVNIEWKDFWFDKVFLEMYNNRLLKKVQYDQAIKPRIMNPNITMKKMAEHPEFDWSYEMLSSPSFSYFIPFDDIYHYIYCNQYGMFDISNPYHRHQWSCLQIEIENGRIRGITSKIIQEYIHYPLPFIHRITDEYMITVQNNDYAFDTHNSNIFQLLNFFILSNRDSSKRWEKIAKKYCMNYRKSQGVRDDYLFLELLHNPNLIYDENEFQYYFLCIDRLYAVNIPPDADDNNNYELECQFFNFTTYLIEKVVNLENKMQSFHVMMEYIRFFLYERDEIKYAMAIVTIYLKYSMWCLHEEAMEMINLFDNDNEEDISCAFSFRYDTITDEGVFFYFMTSGKEERKRKRKTERERERERKRYLPEYFEMIDAYLKNPLIYQRVEYVRMQSIHYYMKNGLAQDLMENRFHPRNINKCINDWGHDD